MLCIFFFFKQKTAYEMRISDWSSDVCSSDLKRHQLLFEKRQPMFHSGEPSPVADRLIERIAGGGRAEDFTIAASETLDALCVQQGFGCRPQGEAGDSARCPMV